MNKKELTKSQRKFVTREKSRIRRQFLDFEKQAEEIGKIKGRFLKQIAAVKGENQPMPAEKPAKPRSESESALLQGKPVSAQSKPAKSAKKAKAPGKPKTKKAAK